MKPSEIRAMSPDEMKRRAVEMREELFNLRFQHGIGQLENLQKIKDTRLNIARIKTIMREQKGV